MGFFDNRIFASFNTLFSRVVNNSNATIVGPTTTLTGEFPQDVTFTRLYEYYNGWPQIKRSIDVEHQKFMGAGIKITSNNEEFNEFIKKWWEITNADKKWSAFFLSVFITGNGLMERQFAPSEQHNQPLLANIEQVPMQTIFRIYRDQFGNDLKLVQVIDGIFKEIDPEFYIRMTINNPDRQAFGKSEFFSVAAPRRVTNEVDPMTQEPSNASRVMESILDSEAELVDAQTEIKKIVAKPKIFGSFPGMPQVQLEKIEKEMQDPNNKKYFWAFNKEAKVAEAQVSDQGKFDKYQEDLNNLIALAGGFPEKIITNPGGFSYASSVTPMDVIDERMANLRSEGTELIRDGLLRPLAKTFGFDDFDEYDVEVAFLPIVRKLKFEEVLQIPDNIVPPEEKREMLGDLQISLNDELYQSAMSKLEDQQAQQLQQEQANFETTNQTNIEKGQPKILTGPGEEQPEKSPLEKDRPVPNMGGAEYLLKNPTVFEAYIGDLVKKGITERLEMSNVKAPTSPSNSVNNTTSGRDPNSQIIDEPPSSTAPPTDLVATEPTQSEPPKVSDPAVLDKLDQEIPKNVEDPREVPPNNQPAQQGKLEATQQPEAGPGDVGVLMPDEDGYGGPTNITAPDLVEANPQDVPPPEIFDPTLQEPTAQDDQPFVANGKPEKTPKGQGIGPIQPTMVTEPGGSDNNIPTDMIGVDPKQTEEPKETVVEPVNSSGLGPGQFVDAFDEKMDNDNKAIMDQPPSFPGGLPPQGLGTTDDGSRGLDLTEEPLTKPEEPPSKPSNVPEVIDKDKKRLENEERTMQLQQSKQKKPEPEIPIAEEKKPFDESKVNRDKGKFASKPGAKGTDKKTPKKAAKSKSSTPKKLSKDIAELIGDQWDNDMNFEDREDFLRKHFGANKEEARAQGSDVWSFSDFSDSEQVNIHQAMVKAELDGKIDWEWNKLPKTKRTQLAIDSGVPKDTAKKMAGLQDWQDVMAGSDGFLRAHGNTVLDYLVGNGTVTKDSAGNKIKKGKKK